jgi:hypothetical protein
MPERKHTRESIVQTLQNIAHRLGQTTLGKREVQPHLPLSAINYHFGNLGTALRAAGLTVTGPDKLALAKRLRVDDAALFESISEVEQRLGHAPNLSEYRANGGSFSSKPFRTRFGSWVSVLQHYNKWKADAGGQDRVAPSQDGGNGKLPTPQPAPVIDPGARTRKLPQLYGEPIDFRGLRHAPINEQGVVYLFGMVSRELGFSVEALQQGFPDCEGKYLHDKSRKLWAKARIEFEFRASNFCEHCHNADECDVIVCWENDWPECPLRVVELRTEIMRLPSR